MSDDLPEGWAATTLGEICSKPQYGWTCRASKAGTIRYLRTTDISGRGIDWPNVPYCEDVPDDIEKYRIEVNDILVSRTGSVGVSCRVPEVPFEAVFASYLIRFKPRRGVETKYVEFFLKSDAYWRAISGIAAGIAVPNVNASKLAELELPLAPLSEQRRIAAKLEQLLGKVDACQQRLANVLKLLKRFRQSVLAAACSGRLTADWREENAADEAGDDLLNNALKERVRIWKHSGRKGTCPEAPKAETSNLPEVPRGWAWIPLGILGDNPFETVQTGPFGALLHKEEFTSSGVPVVAVGNLTGMGFTKEGLYFISTTKAKSLSRFDVRAGDVLFARSGATLGKVCVAPPDAKDWRMTGHILRARLNQDFIVSDFCVFALRGDPAVTGQVFGSVQGTTRPGYNTTLLESIALPVPPVQEQHEIVRRVKELLGLADHIEARTSNARAQISQIRLSTLASAFRGNLVPAEAELARKEGRSYEPASLLLERMRRESVNSRSRANADLRSRRIKRARRLPASARTASR
jgi:type I restriction enzyme S subunit